MRSQHTMDSKYPKKMFHFFWTIACKFQPISSSSINYCIVGRVHSSFSFIGQEPWSIRREMHGDKPLPAISELSTANGLACFVCVDHDHVKWRAKVFSSQFSDSLAIRGPQFAIRRNSWATFLFLPHYDVIQCIYNWTGRGKMLSIVVKFEIFAKMYVLYFSMEISFLVSRQQIN